MRGIKTGGREVGTPNKISVHVRELLTSVLEREIEKIPDYLEQIEKPKDKLEALSRLLPYCIPRLQATEFRDVTEIEGVTCHESRRKEGRNNEVKLMNKRLKILQLIDSVEHESIPRKFLIHATDTEIYLSSSYESTLSLNHHIVKPGMYCKSNSSLR